MARQGSVGKVLRWETRHTLFAIAAAMTTYVMLHTERFLVNRQHPAWGHYGPMGWWLAVHGVFGAVALFGGPLQFSKRLRAAKPKIHRAIGWSYAVSSVVVSVMGIYISLKFEPPVLALAGVVQGSAWTVATVVAVLLAVRRNFKLHEQWMIRSYAMAFVFVETRFVMGVTGLERNIDAITAIVWICAALSAFVPQVVLEWKNIFPMKAAEPRLMARAMAGD